MDNLIEPITFDGYEDPGMFKSIDGGNLYPRV